jgi:hypothetical protein
MAFSMNLLSLSSFAKAIAGQAVYQDFQDSAAESVASQAKAAAPGIEGDFIEADGDKVTYANPRRVWHLVEFGSVNNPAYSPLRRGVVAAGLRFDPAPKP